VIFVTVGVHKQGFDRLIRKMDEIAGAIDEDVIMQVGNTGYAPTNAQFFTFLNEYEKILELNRNARVVVCHGGAGTIITALNQGTPVIAVPRLQEYGEHINDHQLELVRALADEGAICAVYLIDDLDAAIEASYDPRPAKAGTRQMLVQRLKEYIRELDV